LGNTCASPVTLFASSSQRMHLPIPHLSDIAAPMQHSPIYSRCMHSTRQACNKIVPCGWWDAACTHTQVAMRRMGIHADAREDTWQYHACNACCTHGIIRCMITDARGGGVHADRMGTPAKSNDVAVAPLCLLACIIPTCCPNTSTVQCPHPCCMAVPCMRTWRHVHPQVAHPLTALTMGLRFTRHADCCFLCLALMCYL
jgi:hypothetical protein